MKLYTEEQVKEIYFKGVNNGRLHIEGKCSDEVELLTPIELPSDEEIESKLQLPLNYEFEKGSIYSRALSTTIFIIGAKWMRDTIKGGKK